VNNSDTPPRGTIEHKWEAGELMSSLPRFAFDIITVLEADGTIRYQSPSVKRILGYEPDALVSTSVFELLHPEDVERGADALAEALSSPGITRPMVLRWRHADGSWRHLESIGNNLLDDPGVRGIVSTSRDVTDRGRAEEMLKEAEKRYRMLVEQVPAIVYVQELGEPGSTLYVSPRVEEMLGWPPGALIGDYSRWFAMVHPEDRERVIAEVARSLRSDGPFRAEYRFVARDGRFVWVRDEATVVLDADGIPRLWHGVIIDITERKRTEQVLAEAEVLYRTLVEQIPAVAYIQEVGHIDIPLYISPRIEAMSGHPPERFYDDPDLWYGIVHREDRQRVMTEDERTDKTGEHFRMEYRMVHRDGRVVWVRDEAVLVRNEEEPPRLWQGVMFDITDRKEAEQRLREAEEQYRTLVETVPAVTYVQEIDETSTMTYVSPQMVDLLGYTPEECTSDPDHWIKVLHPEDRERVLAENRRTNETGEPFSMEYRQFAKDGRVVWIRDEATLVRGENGESLYWLGVQFDVTERKRAEEVLHQGEERLRRLANAAFEGILITDGSRILEANKALADMIDCDDPSELVGRSALEFVAPEHRDLVQKNLLSGREDPYEIAGLRKDGERRDLEVRGRTISYRGRAARVTAVRDVTERKGYERRLRRQALSDPLTGLPNRILLADRLEHALARVGRRRASVAVLFLDLDNFKFVNDSLGHEVGDQLLIAVAERLRVCLRPEDTVARLGGDEFAVLLEDADRGQAVRVAERVTQELRAPFPIGGHEVFVTASVGISLGASARRRGLGDLLREADQAMYRVKQSGKAGYEIFNPDMATRALERLRLGNDLRRAFDREELKIHYQPKVRIDSGEVVGFEALLRWEHHERGQIPPEELVAVAEETGLIGRLERRTLAETCRLAKEWHERYPSLAERPLLMCANLSARQLHRTGLVEEVAGVLGETGFMGSAVVLEVTESATVGNVETASAVLRRLKKLGVRLAMDDFGTGHSSLSHLGRFPFDFLKIDRSIVAGSDRDPNKAAIVSAAVGLSHALGMEAVAEGVETADELAKLRELGCDLGQGRYWWEPLPREDAEAILRQNLLYRH
jgi:diguanylate cyclase (GGDEF)-like protein/PAS domain S-box-containing protein